jgi:LysM domain
MSVKSQQVTREVAAKGAQAAPAVINRVRGSAGNHTMMKENVSEEKSTSKPVSSSQAAFTFQTFIPDRYVPGTGALGYGDSRGFGKPGDSYRTFQQVLVETDENLNEQGAVGPAKAQTGFSKTAVTVVSGHAPSTPLHMAVKRKDSNSVTVVFFGSIKSGAKLGQLLDAIDFKGWINISHVGGKPNYFFSISHDAFPAYEAFINSDPIYRWCYPATSTVEKLEGGGTAIQETRKTGDAPGGVIGHRPKVLIQELNRKMYPKGELYTVKPGDTLSKIALENLGAASRADEIYDENRDVIGDQTHFLEVGMQLVIHKPIDVHNLKEAMVSATDPQGGLMRIKGAALEYIKNHKTTKNFRLDFVAALKEQALNQINAGSSGESLAGVFDEKKKGASSYGGDLKLSDLPNWATLGTFLLGHCYPEVRYTATLTGNSNIGWRLEWAGVWVINDNLDLVGGSDKGSIYNAVSVLATLGWHDVLGGRKRAEIQAKWDDGGTVRILPTSPQIVNDKKVGSKPAVASADQKPVKNNASVLGGAPKTSGTAGVKTKQPAPSLLTQATSAAEGPQSADEIFKLIARLQQNRSIVPEEEKKPIDDAIKSLNAVLSEMAAAKRLNTYKMSGDVNKSVSLPLYTTESDQYSGIRAMTDQRYGLQGKVPAEANKTTVKPNVELSMPVILQPDTTPAGAREATTKGAVNKPIILPSYTKPAPPKKTTAKTKVDVNKPFNPLVYTAPSDQYSSIEPTIKERYGLKDDAVLPYIETPRDYIDYHKSVIKAVFDRSGGFDTGFDFFNPKSWDKLGTEVTSSPKVRAPNRSLTNDYSVLGVGEGITPDNFVNLMLGRFITGVGPENFVFPLNGKVSNEMRGAQIVENTIQQWYRENWEAILAGGTLRQTVGGDFGVLEQWNLFWEKGGFTNVPNFVGSATVTVIPLMTTVSSPGDLLPRNSGEELLVTIKNVTSATSGDLFKHLGVLGVGTAPSFAKDTLNPRKQQYTNTSQTFMFTVKLDRAKVKFLKDKKKWAEETK